MDNERRMEGGARVEFGHQAKLVTSDGLIVEITLRDLSRGGFRLEHAGADLEVGELVAIQSGRGTAATGEILWVTRREAGGAFIDLAETLN